MEQANQPKKQARLFVGQSHDTRRLVNVTRSIYVVLVLLGIWQRHNLQCIVDMTWHYLRSTWVFNSVYFETWWATIIYPVILIFPLTLDKLRMFDMFKLDPTLKWQSASFVSHLIEALTYSAPLMLLDTFIVKRYYDVDPAEWEIRRVNWIQHTRALPKDPPTVFEIVYQLAFSFIIYDLLFYVVHVLLHKNMWLYKHIHAVHHDHHVVHSRVTNQLSVPERIVLVLSANQALKIMRSHPLTRAIFVPLFLGWLTENHCGYDLPFTLDKVIPLGLIGGSARHYAHHVQGSRHYQPFFTYLDNMFHSQRKEGKKD